MQQKSEIEKVMLRENKVLEIVWKSWKKIVCTFKECVIYLKKKVCDRHPNEKFGETHAQNHIDNEASLCEITQIRKLSNEFI